MTQQACTLNARTPATVRRPLSVMPLLLLLLFLCCASVCVAWDDGVQRGMFKDMINKSGSSRLRMVKQTEEGAGDEEDQENELAPPSVGGEPEVDDTEKNETGDTDTEENERPGNGGEESEKGDEDTGIEDEPELDEEHPENGDNITEESPENPDEGEGTTSSSSDASSSSSSSSSSDASSSSSSSSSSDASSSSSSSVGGNDNVGGDGCATVAPIALAAVALMVITPML